MGISVVGCLSRVLDSVARDRKVSDRFERRGESSRTSCRSCFFTTPERVLLHSYSVVFPQRRSMSTSKVPQTHLTGRQFGCFCSHSSISCNHRFPSPTSPPQQLPQSRSPLTCPLTPPRTNTPRANRRRGRRANPPNTLFNPAPGSNKPYLSTAVSVKKLVTT